MVDGLRAEDVKEALKQYDKWKPLMSPEDKEAVVAAARAWLASQEQTPDLNDYHEYQRRNEAPTVYSDPV